MRGSDFPALRRKLPRRMRNRFDLATEQVGQANISPYKAHGADLPSPRASAFRHRCGGSFPYRSSRS
jgi:hypothetical protein